MSMTTGEAFMKILHEPAIGVFQAGWAEPRKLDFRMSGIGQRAPARAAEAS